MLSIAPSEDPTVPRVTAPTELSEENSHVRPVAARRRATAYQRLVQSLEGLRRLGFPIQDLGYGPCGRTILVRGTYEALEVIGTFEVRFHCPRDRYGVELQLNVGAPTEHERERISTEIRHETNLQTFSTLFNLLRVRSDFHTFEPTETEQVLTALDAVFGPR
jgi:hypothetical protein